MRLAQPPEDSLAVRATTLLAVLLAVGSVAMHEEFRAQSAVAAAAIAVGFWVSYRRRAARNTAVKIVLSLLVLVAGRDFFATLLSNPYDPRIPLVRLFLWLQVLHSFDLPARKDLKYSLISAMLLIAVSAVFARDLSFGLFLLSFTVAACWALVAMGGPPGVSVSLPVAVRYGTILALAVALVGAVVFAAVPHQSGLRIRWMPTSPRISVALRLYQRIVNPAYPQADGSDPRAAPSVFNPQGYIGFSTYVDLRLRGVPDPTVVMRVRATRPALWRGLAFDEYTGQGWRMSDEAVVEYTSEDVRIVPRYGPDERWPMASEQVVQTFYIERDQPNVFFGAYMPIEVFVPTGTLAVDEYAALRSPVPLEPGVVYSVISQAPMPTALLMRTRRGTVPEAIASRYLQLPPMPERVRALAGQITADAATPYDKVTAVHRFLQDYAYTLQAPLLAPGTDAVDEFLFVSRQGACEAFASAMTVLLRAAGVPTRVVTGYSPGVYNVLTGYYEVRNSDAHAWVEVYLAGGGWIPLEPTPGFAVPEPGAVSGRWLARDLVAWMRARVPDGWTAVGLPAGARGSWPVVAAIAVLAAGLLAVAAARRLRRRAGQEEASTPAAALYATMLRILARGGLERDPQVTAREFLQTMPPPVRRHAAPVTELFEQERYGRREVSREHIARAQAAVQALRRPSGSVALPDRRSRAQRGFSLLEILIVVSIIAILAAVLIPNFLRARAQSKVAVSKGNLRNIGILLAQYYNDRNTYPVGNGPVTTELSAALIPTYTSRFPQFDPCTGLAYTYSDLDSNGTTYALTINFQGDCDAIVGTVGDDPDLSYTPDGGLKEGPP